MNQKKYSEMIPSPSMMYDFKVFENWLDGRGVSPSEIRDFLDWAIKNRSPSTAARYKATLKRGISEKYAEQMDMPAHIMLETFFEQIKIPKADAKITEVKVISKDERKILRGTSGEKTKILLQALYETGARVSEILRLKLDDCRTVKGTVYCQVTGKGSKMRTVYLRERTYRKIRQLYRSHTYLFETQPGKPMSRYTAHTLISRAGRRIGQTLASTYAAALEGNGSSEYRHPSTRCVNISGAQLTRHYGKVLSAWDADCQLDYEECRVVPFRQKQLFGAPKMIAEKEIREMSSARQFYFTGKYSSMIAVAQ